ncbi:hypothetical protein [Actinomadura atramentaria]|uniref:hypothetical protein n=1 Tax=Actinomadura atramentaria TaxID=1990 RepID=UPI0003784829|nr:hypothetical protein [Actinomadura atramentaria]
MYFVADLAHPDTDRAARAFDALVMPALTAASRRALDNVLHGGARCPGVARRARCHECETAVRDLALDAFDRLREALDEPGRGRLASVAVHARSAAARDERVADAAELLAAPRSPRHPAWVRCARQQFVALPVRHLEGAVRRRRAVAEGRPARPERDLRTAGWAGELRGDPVDLELLVFDTQRALRGRSDAVEPPADLCRRLGVEPGDAAARVRAMRARLRAVNPGFYHACHRAPSLSMDALRADELPARNADPYTRADRTRAREVVARMLESDERDWLVAIVEAWDGRDVKGFLVGLGRRRVLRLLRLVEAAGLDWVGRRVGE